MSSGFTKPLEDTEDFKSYIPPDYNEEEEPEDFDEIDDPSINEGEQEDYLDTLIKKQDDLKMSGITTPSPPIWASQNNSSTGNNFNSPFGQATQQANNSKPWWQQSSGSTYNSSSNQQVSINRDKKVLICNLLDCITETWESARLNHTPGLVPRGTYDLTPRFDVWDKIRIINPDKIFIIMQDYLLNSTNGSGKDGWNNTLAHYCNALSEYLNRHFSMCQIVAQRSVRIRKQDMLKLVVDTSISQGFKLEDVIYIGNYSGNSNQSNEDMLAAKFCKIDYTDIYTLLNCMN